MLRSDLCDFSDAYIAMKRILLLQNQIMQKEIKVLDLKIMYHLSTAFQRSIMY